jgi:hypothetical protein
MPACALWFSIRAEAPVMFAITMFASIGYCARGGSQATGQDTD